jgi:L-serine dehydratase
MKMPPSIYNDVIGPVMRGPSSSHVAGAARIASLVRRSVKGDILSVDVCFDKNGSLAESYDGHGTDIGFASGILNIELTDPQMPNALQIANDRGINITFRISDYGAVHPNHYRIEAFSTSGIATRWDAISVGGGMIEMQSYNGFPVQINGDFYELLIITDTGKEITVLAERIKDATGQAEFCEIIPGLNRTLIQLKLASPVNQTSLNRLRDMEGVVEVTYLTPILPTPSRAGCSVPYLTAESLLASGHARDKQMWECAALYESIRGDSSVEHVVHQMDDLVHLVERAIDEGLAGTEYGDRILGSQAYLVEQAMSKNILVPGNVINRVIASVTAIMEVKSAMGVIIAAPTAGSCGCLPGTLIGTAREMSFSREKMVEAMLAAGLIGVFIAQSATFAAEVAGCQVECGAGSGMAAAGLVQMFGGSVEQCLDAASLALQNITGLACDPVANRVEVPCLGKNIMGAMNAIASANMILAGYDKVIPLDETIAAVYDIGLRMPQELKCTFGGLGKTPTSVSIRESLAEKTK